MPIMLIEDYANKMPFRFSGKLEKVTIDLKPERSGLKEQEEEDGTAAALRD
jgi:hypothetical protein